MGEAVSCAFGGGVIVPDGEGAGEGAGVEVGPIGVVGVVVEAGVGAVVLGTLQEK